MTFGKLQLGVCAAGCGIYWNRKAGIFNEQTVPSFVCVFHPKWHIGRKFVQVGTFSAKFVDLGIVSLGWFTY